MRFVIMDSRSLEFRHLVLSGPGSDVGGRECALLTGVCVGSYRNDLHAYDLASATWTDLSAPSAGAPPAGRYGHGAAESSGKLYVWGGTKGSLQRRSVHTLSLRPAPRIPFSIYSQASPNLRAPRPSWVSTPVPFFSMFSPPVELYPSLSLCAMALFLHARVDRQEATRSSTTCTSTTSLRALGRTSRTQPPAQHQLAESGREWQLRVASCIYVSARTVQRTLLARSF